MYDQETALYYLQSRYYDPELGRFINADAFTSTGQGILGNNMFAYCGNNPISYADSSGMLPLDNNRLRSHTTLNGGRNLCYGGISGVVRKEDPDWLKALDPANRDAEVVLEAEYFAFYRGVPVVRLDCDMGIGFSFGFIVLDDFYKYNDYGIETLEHEYGHTLHFLTIGALDYFSYTAIPSITGNLLDRAELIPDKMYYNFPWEHIADMYGNISRSEHMPGAGAVAIIY